MTINENYSLKSHNTFGVDSKAKYFIELFDEFELKDYLKSIEPLDEKIYVLGGGSNILLVKDFDGIIIKYSKKGIEVIDESDDIIKININAGVVWDDAVKYCVEKKYYGIENLSAIPGLTGAVPIQNIGAYGVEVKDVVDTVNGYFISDAESAVFNSSECGFGYRNSVFKEKYSNKFVVTSITLTLNKKKKLNLTYRVLKDYFIDKSEDEITIENVSEAIRKIRLEKLPDTNKFGNAGSFFKNPEVSYDHFRMLESRYKDIVYHRIDDDRFKIPAGWLIEKSGFKGKRIGNVGCYNKQALVIVNYGNATGDEILKFADRIRKEVKSNFQIELENEVNIL